MKPKKRKLRLLSRIADFEATIKRVGTKEAAGYRKPGSLNK